MPRGKYKNPQSRANLLIRFARLLCIRRYYMRNSRNHHGDNRNYHGIRAVFQAEGIADDKRQVSDLRPPPGVKKLQTFRLGGFSKDSPTIYIWLGMLIDNPTAMHIWPRGLTYNSPDMHIWPRGLSNNPPDTYIWLGQLINNSPDVHFKLWESTDNLRAMYFRFAHWLALIPTPSGVW